MSEISTSDSATERQRSYRERELVLRWTVKIPLVVAALVASFLVLLFHCNDGVEHFLPPELFIAGGSFFMWGVSAFVGMVMSFVLIQFGKR